jgi:2-(1,2-epoxy-1,2-dihydrophenyl)acetyl-CoA isomerase
MDNQDIIYTKKEGIATIILNRPDKMNALSPGIFEGIHKAVEDASKDNEVRVLVITGTGSAFCSGADVKALAKNAKQPAGEERQREVRRPPVHLALLLQRCEKPVIAAINGVAVGFGLDLALACDIRIASDKARLSEAYIRRGMLPAGGGTFFLPRLVGIDRACLLAWTGDMIDAKEAERMGLVTMVVPHDELESATRELAEKIAKGPAVAIQKTKRAIYEGLGMDLETSLQYTMSVRQELLKSEDHKEGTTSFVEKRAPVFKGK